jgi:hypothetical protein
VPDRIRSVGGKRDVFRFPEAKERKHDTLTARMSTRSLADNHYFQNQREQLFFLFIPFISIYNPYSHFQSHAEQTATGCELARVTPLCTFISGLKTNLSQ